MSTKKEASKSMLISPIENSELPPRLLRRAPTVGHEGDRSVRADEPLELNPSELSYLLHILYIHT